MSEVLVALIRGINVGKAKRVAMADLRAVAEGLGFTGVRTVLNSGNVVFRAEGTAPEAAAAALAEALDARLGVAARVTVLTAEELAAVVAGNPLRVLAADPSRLLVAVPSRAEDLGLLGPVAAQDWAPDAVALGARAAYLWCPAGVLASPLVAAVARALGEGVTSRNWSTMTRLAALAAAER